MLVVPVCHSQFRSEGVAFLVKMVGCGPDTTSYTVLCVLLMMSTLRFRFALPGKWPVCCIGSTITSLCGVIHFAMCLTERKISFWLSFCSFTVFNVFVVIVVVVVGSRDIGATVFVARISLCAFNLLFFVQQGTLISIMSRFFNSGGTFVEVCRRWCLWHVGVQCLLVAHQGLPSHSILIPFLGV